MTGVQTCALPIFLMIFRIFLFWMFSVLCIFFILSIFFFVVVTLSEFLTFLWKKIRQDIQGVNLVSFLVKVLLFIKQYKFITNIIKKLLQVFIDLFCCLHCVWALCASSKRHRNHKFCNIFRKDMWSFFKFQQQAFCFSYDFLVCII